MKEKDIMQLITEDYSWEQVLYKIIAWEGLDPWDLDISELSQNFIGYVEKMEMLDFKIPAKYVIISAVLLRMKSEHLHFIDWLTQPQEEAIEDVGGEIDGGQREIGDLEINPITVPPIRQSKRKITANELVLALRKVLTVQEKRQKKHSNARNQIKISDGKDITERITKLYERINILLTKIKEDEVKFSEIVKKKNRTEMIDTFIPLIYLDNEKKLVCRQEDFFQEIFVSRAPIEKSGGKKLSHGERMRKLVPAV